MNQPPILEQLSLSPSVRHRAVGDEGVLIQLESGRAIVVNEVGLHIVQQLASPKTREALTDSITRHFDISIDQAAEDLERYIAELDKEQLLERHVQD